MGVVAPLLAFCTLAALFNHAGRSWREALLAAAVAWGAWLVVLTETLSLFRLITPLALFAAWSLTLLALVVLAWRLGVRPATIRAKLIPPIQPPRVAPLGAILIAGIVMIAAVTAAIAWIAPPNTWDSMTYHMARVAHWVQNRSVADYPTNIDRQLWLNPGAEFVILHLQVLWGGDRLANFVQWGAMLGTVMGVSLLAGQLGADGRGQMFAAVFAATLPMGVLQASSTQNDYAVGFWMVCTVVFLARLAGSTGASIRSDGLLAAAALGLAILTKGTAYLFLPPLVLWGVAWWAWANWRRPGFGVRLTALILVLALVTLALNLGHYSRNVRLYGSPLGKEDKGTYRVGVFGVGTTASNLMRNGLLLVLLPSPRAYEVMFRAVYWAHHALGLDPNDRRTIDATRFGAAPIRIHEDTMPSPVHTVLLLLAFGAWPLVRLLRERKPAWTLFLAVAGSVLLFCVYLRWQPWGARLLLPVQLVAAAPLGLAAQYAPRRIAATLALVLLVLAVPVLIFNESRPLVGGGEWNILTCPRDKQYFVNRPWMWEVNHDYAARARSRGLERIGLIMDGDQYEYPFWAMVKENNPHTVRLEQVKVEDASKIFLKEPYFADFSPQVTIDFGSR